MRKQKDSVKEWPIGKDILFTYSINTWVSCFSLIKNQVFFNKPVATLPLILHVTSPSVGPTTFDRILRNCTCEISIELKLLLSLHTRNKNKMLNISEELRVCFF